MDVVAEGVQKNDGVTAGVGVGSGSGVVAGAASTTSACRTRKVVQPPQVLRPARVQSRTTRGRTQKQTSPPWKPLDGKREQDTPLGVDGTDRSEQRSPLWIQKPQECPRRCFSLSPGARCLREPAGAVEAEDLAEERGEAGLEEAAEVVPVGGGGRGSFEEERRG